MTLVELHEMEVEIQFLWETFTALLLSESMPIFPTVSETFFKSGMSTQYILKLCNWWRIFNKGGVLIE